MKGVTKPGTVQYHLVEVSPFVYDGRLPAPFRAE